MIKFKVNYIKHDFTQLPEAMAELEIEPKKLAFLIIDMQNDFLSEQGMFAAKNADVSVARRTIEPTRKLAAACRQSGIRVIYSRHNFRPDLSDMGRAWAEVYLRTRAPIGPGSRVGPEGKRVGYLIRDTWNADIVEELSPQEGDIVIDSKRTHTAFYHTDLEHILRNLGIEVIMFAGLTTSICVESTLRDAFHREFSCILLSDCTWEKAPDLQAASEKLVKIHFGYVTSSAEVLQGLGRSA
jgi:ureidoacrylate peracid hydrolase